MKMILKGIIVCGITLLGWVFMMNCNYYCMRVENLPEKYTPVDTLGFEPLNEWEGEDSKPIERPVPKPKKKLIGYKIKYVYRFTINLYATCYSKLDSPVEAKGIYANDDMTELPYRERRIQRHHWTVALPPELDKYHRDLIFVNGRYDHKWRVYVPGYNRFKDYNRKDKTKDEGLSKPRDRVLWKGRIDCLLTTAGKYNSLEQRIRNWGSLNRDCDFYEIVKEPVYEEGYFNDK